MTIDADMLGQTESASSESRRLASADDAFTQKIANLIGDAPVAMLTTVAPDGSLRSRPMATLAPPSENGEVWFFTAENTPKTADIAGEHEVNLSYADPVRERYVSLSGVASLVRDPDRARRAWTPSAAAWFPRGPEDPSLMLLRVRVHTAHEWDADGRDMIELRPSDENPEPAPSPEEAAIEEKMRLGR